MYLKTDAFLLKFASAKDSGLCGFFQTVLRFLFTVNDWGKDSLYNHFNSISIFFTRI